MSFKINSLYLTDSYKVGHKNILHEEVKEANDIFTTQGFSVEEWIQHIRFMRDFYYQKLDIIL